MAMKWSLHSPKETKVDGAMRLFILDSVGGRDDPVVSAQAAGQQGQGCAGQQERDEDGRFLLHCRLVFMALRPLFDIGSE